MDPIPSLIYVTLDVAYDFNNDTHPIEDIIFDTSGTNISVTNHVTPQPEMRMYELVYQLEGAYSFDEYEQVSQARDPIEHTYCT